MYWKTWFNQLREILCSYYKNWVDRNIIFEKSQLSGANHYYTKQAVVFHSHILYHRISNWQTLKDFLPLQNDLSLPIISLSSKSDFVFSFLSVKARNVRNKLFRPDCYYPPMSTGNVAFSRSMHNRLLINARQPRSHCSNGDLILPFSGP